MKFGQSQHDAEFLGYSVEEKSVKIGCKKNEEGESKKKSKPCIKGGN
jgi:hypothetical protein